MKRTVFFLLLLFALQTGCAQDSAVQSPPAPTPTGRKAAVIGLHVAGYAGTLLILNEAWYKDYPKTRFHTFNDNREWLQVDKVGHSWTAYNLARGSDLVWQWGGFTPRKAALLAGISSFSFQTVIEFLDAHSAEWGWSWGDIIANTSGSLLYTGQQLAWGEQRIQFKLSAHPVSYPADLKARARELYGTSFPERLLKDYNGQTYWLSLRLASVRQGSKWPNWLNLAVGYGAQGLYGGFENRALAPDGTVTFDRRDIPRKRQWFLSPDIDFTRFATRRKGVRLLLKFMNTVKLPAPALEWSGGSLKGHWLYF